MILIIKDKDNQAEFTFNNADYNTYYNALHTNYNSNFFLPPNLPISTEQNVLKWASEKKILYKENLHRQLMKFHEEALELIESVTAYIEDNTSEKKKAARLEHGDVQVTLTLLANMLNTNNATCFEAAYDKIKNRKGKTINGQFVKEKDL